MKAIFIGDRNKLAKSLKESFIKTGTVHIIAISGLNVGLIAALFLFLFSAVRIPRKPAIFLTNFILIFYAVVAGSDPPILRAVIMFSVCSIAYIINRESDILNSLGIAALMLLFYNPRELFDPGFQLSFLSIISAVVLTPKIADLFKMPKSISLSLAACLGLCPVISSYFNIISPISIIANLVVVPYLFAIMLASFVFLALSVVSAAVTSYAAAVLVIMLKILFFITGVFAKVPFAYLRTQAPGVIFFIAYYAFLSLLFFSRRKKEAVMALLIILNALTWKEVLDSKKDIFKITFLDVGQGDSILMEFPGDKNILIDAGTEFAANAIAAYLWNKGVTKLDAVIVTHFHDDHLGGMPYILDNFKVGCAVDNGADSAGNFNYEEYKRIIRNKNIRRLTVGEGDELRLGNGRIFVLNPPKGESVSDSNDNSLVMKIQYKNFAMLLCGDVTSNAMKRILNYNDFLNSDIIKIPHHGGNLGDESITREFFKRASPVYSVISVGRNNRFKAPSQKTINIITSLNSISYDTKDSGAIEVVVGDKGFNVAPYLYNNMEN